MTDIFDIECKEIENLEKQIERFSHYNGFEELVIELKGKLTTKKYDMIEYYRYLASQWFDNRERNDCRFRRNC